MNTAAIFILLMITLVIADKLISAYGVDISNPLSARINRSAFHVESINENEVGIKNIGTEPIRRLVFDVNGTSINYTGPDLLEPDEVGRYILDRTQLFSISDNPTIHIASDNWMDEINASLAAANNMLLQIASGIKVYSLAYDSAVVVWNTSKESTPMVKYGTTTGSYTNFATGSGGTLHYVLLSGLIPSTEYYFVVNSTDFSGNSVQSNESKFRTEAGQKIQSSSPQEARNLSASYSPISSHWSHINVLDFGREIKYLPDSVRSQAMEWYASHIDVKEVGMQNFIYNFNSNELSYIKSKNPTMKTFGYDFDLSMCQHQGCWLGGSVNTAQSDLPEDYYLHFSSDTQLKFIGLGGTTTVSTITIQGCPESQPATKDCRVQIFKWKDYRWLANMKNTQWQKWYADHLIADMAAQIDGTFLDEHGSGFSIPSSWGYQTLLISGGNIREYGNMIPKNYNWEIFDSLDQQYNNDVTGWLSYLQSRFQAVGKFLLVNTAESFTNNLSFSQNLAAKGVTTEHLNAPESFVKGANQYQELIDKTKALAASGGIVDLYGNPCYYGSPDMTAGNYANSKERYWMWRLASYYILKESPNDSGTVYFNPNLCINTSSSNPLDFMDEWIPAYEVNVGQPASASYVYKAGNSAGCVHDYKIFAREYGNVLVLVRSRNGWSCTDYGDSSAVDVALPSPMMMLKADGTLSAYTNTIKIRNAEAVIMLKI